MLPTYRRSYFRVIRNLFRVIHRLRQRIKRFASILADCLVSRPVRETLSLDTLHGKRRTFPIVDT
jgi:hypothetical protein